MKQVFLLLALTFSVSMLLGQVAFSHVTNATNTSGHITTLDHSALNNNPNAVVFVSPVWEMNGDQNPVHTFGVWYNGSRWTIFNQNRTAMDISAGKTFRFNVLAFASSTSSTFVHTVTSSNKRVHITTLDHPSINNNPNAAITVTQLYGVYNTHEIGVWYDNGRWTIFNQDRVELPLNAKFNVLIGTGDIAGASIIRHTHTSATKLAAPNIGYTVLNNATINNKKDWRLFVTQRWISAYNPYVYNIWYDDPTDAFRNYKDGYWLIFNSRNEEMPVNAAFNILAVPTYIATGLPAPTLLSPACGSTFNIFPRTTNLSWRAVSGAASYVVEIDCYHCCESGKWCTDLGRTWRIERGITATSYTFDYVGAQPGRWRVSAVDASGREGAKSAWCEFTYTR